MRGFLLIIKCLFIAMVIHFTVLTGLTYAACLESSRGSLQPGSAGPYLRQAMTIQQKKVPGGAVYVVQKPAGYYFKICNESQQVSNFMSHWVYPEIPKGSWDLIITARNMNEVTPRITKGIYKIKAVSNNWEVYQYKSQTKKSKKAAADNKKIAAVKIKGNPSIRKFMDKFGKKYCFFTPKESPIKSLKEISKKSFAVSTDGAGFPAISDGSKFLGAAINDNNVAGLKVIGLGNPVFCDENFRPKLFMVACGMASHIRCGREVKFID